MERLKNRSSLALNGRFHAKKGYKSLGPQYGIGITGEAQIDFGNNSFCFNEDREPRSAYLGGNQRVIIFCVNYSMYIIDF